MLDFFAPLLAVGSFSDREFYNQTVLHPIAAGMLSIAVVALLTLPRNRVFLPFFMLLSFVPEAQRVAVLTLDFRFLRLLVLFAWIRLFIRGELRPFKWCAIDYLIIGWQVFRGVGTTLSNEGTSGIIYSCGQLFDAVGTYFFFRVAIRDREDVVRVLKDAMLVAIPIALFFLAEKQTARNIFSVFGGVREATFVRDGRLRIQGAYAHPIIAGCLWAVMLPQFVAILMRAKESKFLPFIGVTCTLIIIYCCASSTPVMAVLFGMMAGAMFQVRSLLPLVRWGIPITLFGLHMVMEAPVWHLISRIDVVGGSTGWHRYSLIDKFIRYTNEWWLHGVKSTAHWGIIDITNQYVLEGIFGGLITLVLFVLMIGYGFFAVRKAMERAPHDRWQQIFYWSFGVGLFMHVMNFIAVSYFGQIMLIWYLQLALLAVLWTAPPDHAGAVPVAQATQPVPRRRVARGAPEIYA